MGSTNDIHTSKGGKTTVVQAKYIGAVGEGATATIGAMGDGAKASLRVHNGGKDSTSNNR